MLNAVWVIMIVAAVLCGLASGRMEAVSKASVDSAGAAVDLAIGLVGVMAFWIGAMTVLQKSGALHVVARLLRRPMAWLFPDVPPDHPAMSMMIMNMTSNMMGLGNAATPFGLKAMIELDTLNREKGTASDAMALFLAINTSQLALLPSGMISLRSALGSASAGSIILPTIAASAMSTLVAIVVAKITCKLPRFALKAGSSVAGSEDESSASQVRDDIDTRAAEELIAENPPWVSGWRRVALIASTATIAGFVTLGLWELIAGTPSFFTSIKTSLGGAATSGEGLTGLRTAAGAWLLPLLIVFITLLGTGKGVKVYDSLVEGGKEGFNIGLRIIPFLVAILVAVGMLRASGAIDLLVAVLDPFTSLVGMPGEALPMALLRPLSGSGAYAVAAEIMKTHGPDSLIGNIVSTMQGSTETTFYVLALYFGVVNIRRVRHTLIPCLAADITGALASCWMVRLFIF